MFTETNKDFNINMSVLAEVSLDKVVLLDWEFQEP